MSMSEREADNFHMMLSQAEPHSRLFGETGIKKLSSLVSESLTSQAEGAPQPPPRPFGTSRRVNFVPYSQTRTPYGVQHRDPAPCFSTLKIGPTIRGSEIGMRHWFLHAKCVPPGMCSLPTAGNLLIKANNLSTSNDLYRLSHTLGSN